MIAADQPTIFPDGVVVRISSVGDGSMKDGVEIMTPEAVHSRTVFLEGNAMPSDQVAVMFADYATDNFCVYREAAAGLMAGTDATVVCDLDRPVLLPLADCLGAVIYDPMNHVLMVSHLGRHSVEQYGGTRSIQYLVDHYGADPAELLVWLGPSPNAVDYPLHAFGNRSFVDVVTEQLFTAGISRESIEVSHVDTATNPHYFSHSQFIKGAQATDGRYAIVAMLK